MSLNLILHDIDDLPYAYCLKAFYTMGWTHVWSWALLYFVISVIGVLVILNIESFKPRTFNNNRSDHLRSYDDQLSQIIELNVLCRFKIDRDMQIKWTETLGDEANANIFGTTLLSASLNHSRKESVCGTYWWAILTHLATFKKRDCYKSGNINK